MPLVHLYVAACMLISLVFGRKVHRLMSEQASNSLNHRSTRQGNWGSPSRAQMTIGYRSGLERLIASVSRYTQKVIKERKCFCIEDNLTFLTLIPDGKGWSGPCVKYM